MMFSDGRRQPATAVQAVVEFVENGRRENLFPGGRLPPEAEICSAVGVSRTPVREAMKVLEAVGVVEIRRGVGTFLQHQAASALGDLMLFRAAMKRATPQQLYETRLMVERAAAQLLAKRRTDKDIVAMKAANEQMRVLSQEDPVDLDRLTEADVAFHHVIFDSCGNTLVAAIGRFVVSLCAPWIREGHRHVGGMVSVRNHAMIISMIEQRNVEGAGAAAFDRPVHEGLANWQATLERSCRKGGATGGPKSADGNPG